MEKNKEGRSYSLRETVRDGERENDLERYQFSHYKSLVAQLFSEVHLRWASLVAQTVKNLPEMQQAKVQFLG